MLDLPRAESAGDDPGWTRPNRRTASLISDLRNGGVKQANPTTSVKNPGVSNNAPAARRNKPSSSSNAGNSPRAALRRTRFRADRPCSRTSQAPTSAVRTTSAMVHGAPITFPTLINKKISINGTARKIRKIIGTVKVRLRSQWHISTQQHKELNSIVGAKCSRLSDDRRSGSLQ